MWNRSARWRRRFAKFVPDLSKPLPNPPHTPSVLFDRGEIDSVLSPQWLLNALASSSTSPPAIKHRVGGGRELKALRLLGNSLPPEKLIESLFWRVEIFL